MMDYGYGYSPFFAPFHLVGTLLFVLFIVFLISLIFRGPGRMRRWHMWHMHDALSILNERFAKGEIEKAEYEERKRALMGQ